MKKSLTLRRVNCLLVYALTGQKNYFRSVLPYCYALALMLLIFAVGAVRFLLFLLQP